YVSPRPIRPETGDRTPEQSPPAARFRSSPSRICCPVGSTGRPGPAKPHEGKTDTGTTGRNKTGQNETNTKKGRRNFDSGGPFASTFSRGKAYWGFWVWYRRAT